MGHAPPELRMSFSDCAALEREVEINLAHGRAFVQSALAIGVLDDCTLVLVHPGGATLALPAQAVMVTGAGASQGIGIQLRPFGAATIEALRAFVTAPPAAHAPAQPAAAASAPEDMAVGAPGGGEAASAPAGGEVFGSTPPTADAEGAAHDALGGEPPEPLDAGDDAESEPAGDDGAPSDVQRQAPRHERLRNLNATEQVKLARKGELNDRLMLERLYGRGVWEALLQNPKLTLPEVATIARKGSVPRPLLEAIVDNNAWIQSPLVRRALLSNPRVSSEAILKLLRMTPKHELKVIWKTTTYSQQVRETAKKVLEM